MPVLLAKFLRAPTVVLLAWAATGSARASAPAPAAAAAWKDAGRITPEELSDVLRAKGGEKPAVFCVGFRPLFAQAHVPGSRFVGPGRDPQGLDALRKAAGALPKEKAIVLYCGCCPWPHCPNMEPAWKALREAGFTNVKVLYIAQNFGADWARKGYPVESGGAP